MVDILQTTNVFSITEIIVFWCVCHCLIFFRVLIDDALTLVQVMRIIYPDDDYNNRDRSIENNNGDSQ